jgi:hypothetical protein
MDLALLGGRRNISLIELELNYGSVRITYQSKFCYAHVCILGTYIAG